MALDTPQAIVLGVLVASTGAAAAIDIARRRIPNALSLATVVAGITLAATGVSGIPVWSSIAGLVIGFALMLPGHAFGGTGAGDVKLFAGSPARSRVPPPCSTGRRRPGWRSNRRRRTTASRSVRRLPPAASSQCCGEW
jgi:hypothetical protein